MITEEAIEAAWKKYRDGALAVRVSKTDFLGGFEAALSTLPIAGEGKVKVRALEWSEDSYGNWFADSPFGSEFIQKWKFSGIDKTVFEYEGTNYDTVAAAKAAAQADFETRILSALISSPGKEVEVVALYQVELEDGTIDHISGVFGMPVQINGMPVSKVTPLYARPQPASTALVERGNLACPCTTFQQDEDCEVGYPSLLCTACDGKGITTVDKVVALAAEMMKVAEQVDELEDPFAAWETIDLLKSQNETLTKALEEISDTRCVHDMGFDREIGPLGCSLGDKCVCVGLCTIASRALQEITTKGQELQAVAWRWKWKDGGSWIVTEGEPDANERRIIEPLYKSAHVAEPVEYHIVFDGFPSPDGPRFIEVENAAGQSINAGEWRKRADGLCELVIKAGVLING